MIAWLLLSVLMTLLNYTVYCKSSKRTILPWRIVRVHPPSHTYSSFFEVEVKASCPANCELSQVHVGRSKDGLDLVDSSLTIADVTNVFGSFVKFSVDAASELATDEQASSAEVWLRKFKRKYSDSIYFFQ